MTKLGLERNQEALKDLTKNYEYNLDLQKVNNLKRSTDMKWAKYIMEEKEKEEGKILEMIKKDIEDKKEMIKQAYDHLEKGIEVKKPIGID